mgnify:CR=1 FL=1
MYCISTKLHKNSHRPFFFYLNIFVFRNMMSFRNMGCCLVTTACKPCIAFYFIFFFFWGVFLGGGGVLMYSAVRPLVCFVYICLHFLCNSYACHTGSCFHKFQYCVIEESQKPADNALNQSSTFSAPLSPVYRKGCINMCALILFSKR